MIRSEVGHIVDGVKTDVSQQVNDLSASIATIQKLSVDLEKQMNKSTTSVAGDFKSSCDNISIELVKKLSNATATFEAKNNESAEKLSKELVGRIQ